MPTTTTEYDDLTAAQLLNHDGAPMTVAGLIEQLAKLPPDAPVLLALYGPDAHEASPLDHLAEVAYFPDTPYLGEVMFEPDPDDPDLDADGPAVAAVVLVPSGITPVQEAAFVAGEETSC